MLRARGAWRALLAIGLCLALGLGISLAQSEGGAGQARQSARLQSPALVAASLAKTLPSTESSQVGPWEYPYGISSLTGLPYPGEEALQRRNLIVKVSNWPPEVRPQHGLNQADLVFEYEAEGGVTRFAGIYRSQAPAKVGSVRSARLLDIELLTMYAALLAYSGTSEPIHDIYLNAPFRPVLLSTSLGESCQRGGFCRDASITSLGYEHTLFGDTGKMWELATLRNVNHGYRANGLAFDLRPSEDGLPAGELYINWYQRTDVRWHYDESSRRYIRHADGQPHLDAADGEQLWADNLVLLEAAHNRRPDLFTPGSIDESYEVALWGKGPVMIMREGQLYYGLWWRQNQNRGEALRLIFPDGEPIPLKPGRTWLTILRSLESAQVSAEPVPLAAVPEQE